MKEQSWITSNTWFRRSIFSPRIFKQPEKQYDHFTPTTQWEAASEGSREGAAGSIYRDPSWCVFWGQNLHTFLKPTRSFLSCEHVMLRRFIWSGLLVLGHHLHFSIWFTELNHPCAPRPLSTLPWFQNPCFWFCQSMIFSIAFIANLFESSTSHKFTF